MILPEIFRTTHPEMRISLWRPELQTSSSTHWLLWARSVPQAGELELVPMTDISSKSQPEAGVSPCCFSGLELSGCILSREGDV